MNLKIEMENGKKYTVNYNESLDMFLEHVQFEQSNAFLLTSDGTYINIKKIVEFKPEGNN